MDRIVLNAYNTLCYSAGSFRTWWRQLMDGCDEQSDNAHLNALGRSHPAAWRTIYAVRTTVTPAEFRRQLLGLYVDGLRRLGYLHVPDARLVCRPDGRPLYFMVFATDHPAGESIMTAALNAVEATTRQTSFLPYNQRY